MLNKLLGIFNKKEITKGGSTVYRHQSPAKSDKTEELYQEEMNLVHQHVEKYIGTIKSVLHEISSEGIHLDVIWVSPSEKLPYNILVTMGASAYKMEIPKDLDERFSFAEYAIFLPKDWPIDPESWKDENNYWPIRMLKQIARLPNVYKTWLYYGHTIPNGNPSKPYALATEIDGCMVTFPYLLDKEFVTMQSINKKVTFWCVAPLYQSEWQYKLDHGAEALEDLADEKGITHFIVDPKRPKIV